MSDTDKPKWWNDIPDDACIKLTKKEFLDYLDGAVSEGRCSHDNYYGINNEFHLAQILDGCEKELKGRFK
jgi:hypothetical protein